MTCECCNENAVNIGNTICEQCYWEGVEFAMRWRGTLMRAIKDDRAKQSAGIQDLPTLIDLVRFVID